MKKSAKIYVAGHRGMVGSAIVRKLYENGYGNVIFRTHDELDLCEQIEVRKFLEEEKPDAIIIAAAKVGGIGANNKYPAEFIYSNLNISTNLIHEAYKCGIDKVVFLGSSCIYPRLAPQPIREDALLSGPLEKTNEAYAVAKIAAMKMCEYYRKQYGVNYHSVMPTNLYGPGDNYHPFNSHVLPALLKRIHDAKINNDKEVEIWGTGSPLREFLHVDDMADATVFMLEQDNPPDWVNVGTGKEISILNLAKMIKEVVHYDGDIVFDSSKPDGTPRKLIDSSLINYLGWKAEISLKEGLKKTYSSFLSELSNNTIRNS
ncbi:MAG: GDP-L-fucose synthase [Kiritimatiellae bacterium]|jgi:GDP-L-fucose synthase|nr:GDP-L-fucose synthase [Kiritimatiellia bacterium]